MRLALSLNHLPKPIFNLLPAPLPLGAWTFKRIINNIVYNLYV